MDSLDSVRKPLQLASSELRVRTDDETTSEASQSILYRGKLVKKPVSSGTLYNSCDRPVMEAMCCPCGQSLICQKCIVHDLAVNSGLGLKGIVCSQCNLSQRNSEELRREGQLLEQRVSSAVKNSLYTTKSGHTQRTQAQSDRHSPQIDTSHLLDIETTTALH